MGTAKILIVEDERIVARDIENRLIHMGYSIAGISSSGEKAIQKIKSDQPDLVLMDIKLKGGMDGIETAEAIRRDYDIPFVYLTAYGSEGIIERAKISEPFGYLLKPFEDRELHTVIEIALYRHKTEKRLKESEKSYRKLFEDSRDALFTTDLRGNLIGFNQSFLNLLEYERGELAGMRAQKLFLSRAVLKETFSGIRKGGSVVNREARLMKKGGGIADCLITVTTITDKGVATGYQGSIHDITHRKQLEARLFHARKLEAVGTVASRVAHDFNNILTVISGYTTLMQRNSIDESTGRYANEISKACEKASNLTKSLLTFSRRQSINPKNIKASEAFAHNAIFLQGLIDKNIQIKLLVADNDFTIYSDPEQLGQVLMNMIKNAGDAMPCGGTITIKAERAKIDREFIMAHNYGVPGEYALIAIQDTGVGMDKTVMARIFEPFYTTKGFGKGTGLGLAIVYGIIKEHNGFIDVESEPDAGTTFRIYLPAMELQAGTRQTTEDYKIVPFRASARSF